MHRLAIDQMVLSNAPSMFKTAQSCNARVALESCIALAKLSPALIAAVLAPLEQCSTSLVMPRAHHTNYQ